MDHLMRTRLTLSLTLATTLFATAFPAVLASQQAAGEPWRIVRPSESSLVLARDGSLIGEIGKEWRTYVRIGSLPGYVPHAFVAIEDHRFYQHDGVDVVGIAGALKDNLLGGSRGASTITQQLVGNMHPDIIDRTDRSISRKLREQSAAREMERHYTKNEILEAYLNQISFGRGWFGIDAAARHYFGKPASRLSVAEAASLAALPKGPAIYDPVKYPSRNKNRRDAIIGLMKEQGYITAQQAKLALAEPLRTAPDLGMSAASPYFVDVVRTQAERAGIQVSGGGYRIHTTLDPGLQRAAAAALTEGIVELEAREGYAHQTFAKKARGSTDYLQGAVVAIDPATGDVRALVGGRHYGESQFNRAVNAVRQPGSSFKPVVYARALMDSMAPNSIVHDDSLEIAYDAQVYRPKNADGEFMGPITLRESLARSRNPVAVQLWQQLGADTVIAFAERLGLRAPIAPYPSSAVGASVVRPLDLVAAYTAFANLGAAVEPRFILRVEDGAGRTVYGQETTFLPVAMDTAVAFVTREMMRDVVDRGTANSVRRYVPWEVPVAGKTGTTDNNADVWFIGMTPQLVAGVWLGFDRPKTITPGAGGGSLAAPIFGEMLARWGALTAAAWEVPADVVVAELDRDTGLLAETVTPAERRYMEYFVPGTEPGPLRVDARRLFRLGPIALH
jgi:1A family penicillin-binding protein